MSITEFAGPSVHIPAMTGISIAPTLQTTFTIASANSSDKLSMVGRVSFTERTGTKNIHKVHFNFGTVVKSNGSTVRVSLQDVDLANGPVIRPDGTADQSFTIANADASFASNTWYTGTLGADRTVTFGDLLAVVWDWASATSGDSIIINGFTISSTSSNAGSASQQGCCVAFTAAAWAVNAMAPNVILEFDDGTFGTLHGSMPVSAVGSTVYNSGSAADEFCLEFQLPMAAECDGLWTMALPATGGDFDVILYDGTTALASYSVDANAVQAASARYVRGKIAKQNLSANHTYRIAVKPTTTNNVTIYYFDINSAAHRSLLSFGTTGQLNSRVDAGAWGSATTTRRMWAGIELSGVDTGGAAAQTAYASIG